jgi:hypothetical protein
LAPSFSQLSKLKPVKPELVDEQQRNEFVPAAIVLANDKRSQLISDASVSVDTNIQPSLNPQQILNSKERGPSLNNKNAPKTKSIFEFAFYII